MSYSDLFSRRIGFPFPVVSLALPEQQQVGTYVRGRNRVMIPLLRRRFTIQGTEIYQPMFRNRNSDPTTRVLYDTQYVRDNSIQWEHGIGKLFIQGNSKLIEYPLSLSNEYIPKISYDITDLLFKIQIQTIEWQIFIDSLAPSIENLPPEEKERLSSHRIRMSQLNKELIRVLQGKYSKSIA